MTDLLRSDFVLLIADGLLTFVLLKATLLLILVAVLLRLLVRAPAALRAAACTTGFAALVALPLAGYLSPVRELLPVLRFPRPLFRRNVWGGVLPDLNDVAGRATADFATAFASVPAVSWLALVWAAGAAYLVLRFVLDHRHVSELGRRARPAIDGRSRSLLARAARRVGVSRRVRLAYTDSPAAPLTFGTHAPVILLPTSAREWPSARLTAVLCHELAHVRRRDYVTLILAELAVALFWLNPIAWRLRARTRLEQDRACDAAVLHTGVDRADYARHLLAIARIAGRRPAAAALPLLRRPGLRDRVRAILDAAPAPPPSNRARRTAAIVIVMLSVAATLAATDLWICPAAHSGPAPPTEISA